MKKIIFTLFIALFAFKVSHAQLPKISFHSCESTTIEAGKEVELKVTVINDGEIATDNNTHITLTSENKYVTITNGNATLGALEPNETQEVVFSIMINKMVPDESNIHFSLNSILEGSSIESYLYYDFEEGFQDWTAIDADCDGFNWIDSETRLGSGYGHESEFCMFSQSYDNTFDVLYPDNYLVTPEKFTIGADAIFSFWACAQDMNYPAEHFGLAISSTGNTSGNDFTTIEEWTLTAKSNRDQGTWYQYTVDLSEYEGQELWLALRHFDCFDEYFLAVDDVEIINVMQPMCWTNKFSIKSNNPTPNIIVKSVSHKTIKAGEECDVEITFINDGTSATTHEYDAVLTSDDEFITIIKGENVLEPMDCQETSTKTFAIVTSESTPENHNITFNITITSEELTDKDEDVSFVYDFENDLENWTTIDGNNDGHIWYHTSEVEPHNVTKVPSYSGKGHLMSESSCNASLEGLTPDDYIVSPMRIGVKENTTISFWACAQDLYYPDEHFGVAVSTTGNTSADDFTTIEEWTLTAKAYNGEWYQFTADLSEYEGQYIWVALRHFKCTDIFILCVDDISINNFVRSHDWSSSFSLSTTGNTSLSEQDIVLNIYPNPTKDRLHINTNNIVKEIEVFDVKGTSIISTNDISTNDIDISSLEKGVYFIKIKTDNGEIVRQVVKF